MGPRVVADELRCLGQGPAAARGHGGLGLQEQLALRVAGVARGHLQGEHIDDLHLGALPPWAGWRRPEHQGSALGADAAVGLVVGGHRWEWGSCLFGRGGHHGRPDQAAMESNEQTTQQEMVLVTLELPRDVVDWIDGLKAQMGFRSRGLIVTQLLRELIPALVDHDDQSDAEKAA